MPIALLVFIIEKINDNYRREDMTIKMDSDSIVNSGMFNS